jgi:hypothetical protein
MTDDYSIYIIVSICLSIVMVLIVIYTSSVSKFTPRDKGSFIKFNGGLKKLQIVSINPDSKVLPSGRGAILFGIAQNDTLYLAVFGPNSKHSQEPTQTKWILLPGLLNRAVAMHSVYDGKEEIRILGLNSSNDLYRADFDLDGRMIHNWEKITNGENFSDIVDIVTNHNAGAVLLDKAGNMFGTR